MDHPTIKKTAAHLSESQRCALISLLSDEDPVVYETVKQTLLGYGVEAAGWLRPNLTHPDPLMRRRASEIVSHLDGVVADNDFLAFCISQPEDLDLEKGAWMLARTQYPEINIEAYRALLDSFADELRDRISKVSGTTDSLLATINEYLFETLGFRGNEKDYYNPDNSYLNRVVDRRLGNPISLCLAYLLITKRLRLPIVGIGMPGHFICRFQSSVTEVYIDVFFRGKLLTKAECIKYLVQAGHGYLDGYLAPVTPRRMLLRVCANLHQIYVDLSSPKDVARMQRYIVALSK
ncbi:MAG TPA: transglutaminase-like domain-containing protein [Candidatus Paceibacterota bacterium]|nr:transglutaminase-like domain-containing protein [Verrucomicrobiota bacterium]HRY47197.1 transglutaminase-like domain-containing protein [Candidatus Paceibacterota bacterium]HSA02820.1 transglutaminase-like domain-containing protein [Candidatus Paceibacterota bacterium]